METKITINEKLELDFFNIKNDVIVLNVMNFATGKALPIFISKNEAILIAGSITENLLTVKTKDTIITGMQSSLWIISQLSTQQQVKDEAIKALKLNNKSDCECCEGTGLIYTSCCGDDMRGTDIDLCPTCHEHCGDESELCPECGGTGIKAPL